MKLSRHNFMRYCLRTLLIVLGITAMAVCGALLDFETVTRIEQWVGLAGLVVIATFVLAILSTEFVPLLIGIKPRVLISERRKLTLLHTFPCVSLLFFVICEIVKRL